jgi:SAM-dependent methyltransferase
MEAHKDGGIKSGETRASIGADPMSLRSRLFHVYWSIRRVVAPQLRYSQYVYEDVLRKYVNPSVDWIEIGCGHAILPPWRSAQERELVANCRAVFGIDYDWPSLKAHATISKKLRGDVSRLPFREEACDLVTANMVVEHLDNPSIQFREIHRILRPKGIFLFHTPNAYGYGVLLSRLVPESIKGKLVQLVEGRQAQDIFETHYAANTEKSIRQLALAAGFEVMEIRLLMTDAIFAMIPPLALVELLWIRLLMSEPFRSLRSNFIVALRKL